LRRTASIAAQRIALASARLASTLGVLMPVWIPVTLSAALFQAWRTAIQQRLRAMLSVNAAGLVRYLYGVPVGLALLLVAHAAGAGAIPHPNLRFLIAAAGAGFCQILGTNLLIMAFGYRNFAVGTAYAKTEAAQSAVLAWLLLGQALHPLAVVGILIGAAGVLTLSLGGRGMRPGDLLKASFQPAALCGLGVGFAFSITSILVKTASDALVPAGGAAPGFLISALFTLVVTNALQTLMQGGWLAWTAPAELAKCFSVWRTAIWVGALSAFGSACWFTGFVLAPVALVRAVGQIEIVFVLLFSHFYLKETLRRFEFAGVALVVAGVLLIVLRH
jgi:drug/metabolite transporter (DMT)-like permease